MSKKFMAIIVLCLLLLTSISAIYAYEYVATDESQSSNETLSDNITVTSHHYNYIVEEIDCNDENGKVIHKYTQTDSGN